MAQAVNSFTRSELASIRAMLLLGNPVSAGDTDYDLALTVTGGLGTHTGGGALDRVVAPVDIQRRTVDLCITSDPICDGSRATLAGAAFNDFPHREYERCCGEFPAPNVLGVRFADFLSGRLAG